MLQYTSAANETERECSLPSTSPPTLRMGLLLYAQGVTDRWQHRQGQKGKGAAVGTSTCYSVSYLTLTAGDKGLKCPSASPKQCKRDRQGRHRSPRWQSCQRRLPPRTPGCTASRHVRLEGSQSDTLVDVLERGHRVVACCGKCLAAVVVLSRPGACRSPGLAGTRGAPRQVP